MTDRYRFLRQVYFFNTLSDGEISQIEGVCHEESHEPQDVIFWEGDNPDKFYIILEGAVEVWKDFTSPEKDLLAVHTRGSMFGEMALIDDLPRSATVVSRNKTRLITIDRNDFHTIIRSNSSIAVSIMISVSSMIRRSNENFVEGLRKRNRELETANKELKETQDELLRAERLSHLGKFSSLILHDIRNPISVLRGYGEMIALSSENPEKVKKYALNILREADRINRLAGELLDYSRGDIRLNVSIVDLSDLVDEVHENIESRFTARSIRINRVIEFRGPVLLDKERMLRVFLNIAENSRKAMSQGGEFEIRVTREASNLRILFTDTGIGMDKQVLSRLFEPFHSASEGGGTGLGMVIVRSIVEAHDGSLQVESEKGKGTLIRISIPLRD